MKRDDIDNILQKYYDGLTTEKEERKLRDFFQATPVPEHLKADATLFTQLKEAAEEELDKNLNDKWLLEKVENAAKTKVFKMPHFLRYWHVAASFIVLVAAMWIVSNNRNRSANVQNPEIVALRKEVQEIKQVLTASTSASDRIRVVSRDFNSSRHKEVIDLLVSTLNRDANVNVRLAACEALYQFRDNPKARTAFIEALHMQTDPMVQFTLINILSLLREKRAIKELKQLFNRENVIPEVKQKAAQVLTTLNKI